MKYRTKPVVIDAIQWTGDNADEIVHWAQGGWHAGGMWLKQMMIDPESDPPECVWRLVIPTLEGDHDASPGDYIIRGLKGEFYPCKPDIFKLKYQDINEPW